MPKQNVRRKLGFVLATLVAGGLLAFAGVSVLRWHARQNDGNPNAGKVQAEAVPLEQAPVLVQQVAGRLTSSRVGFAVPADRDTYLVISTGESGERVVLDAVKAHRGKALDVTLTQSPAAGGRLLVVRVHDKLSVGHVIRYYLDGVNAIAAVVNADNLPPVPLPAAGTLAVVAPRPNGRVTGTQLTVSGFARIGVDETLSVRVLGGEKGQVLGEASGIRAAALAPDWGSFRVALPLEIPESVTTGTVWVVNDKTGERVSVDVRLSGASSTPAGSD